MFGVPTVIIISTQASAIEGLSENYRQIILLKFSHGFTDGEIASILGIYKGNVAKRIQRSKKKLNNLIN